MTLGETTDSQKKYDRKKKILMKIGILGTRGIPNAYGGFEQFAEFLAAGLVKRGHDVTVYNSSSHPYKPSEWQGVKLIHCPDPENKIGTAGQFIYDFNCIRDARKSKFEIVLHLGYTSSSIWYWYWPKGTSNIVNMDGLEWKRTKYNKPTRRFLRWAEGLAARHADALIADSIGIQDHIQKTYKKQAIYIPYGAEIPGIFSKDVLKNYRVEAFKYFLVIARMEPENNIEMIIRGYMQATSDDPLLLIGNTNNKFTKYLLATYRSDKIRFIGSIYEKDKINSLRHYAAMYFHGHSVGGTNPSLLEAMACGCNIAAHDNVFNRAILTDYAFFFSTPDDIRNIINKSISELPIVNRKDQNIEKVKTIYNWESIINKYEQTFKECLETRKKSN